MYTVNFEQTIHLVFFYYPGRELNFAVGSRSNVKGNLHTNGLQIQEGNVSIHFLVGAHVGIVDLAFQISPYKRKSDGVCRGASSGCLAVTEKSADVSVIVSRNVDQAVLKFAIDMGVIHILATSLLRPSLTRPRQLSGSDWCWGSPSASHRGVYLPPFRVTQSLTSAECNSKAAHIVGLPGCWP